MIRGFHPTLLLLLIIFTGVVRCQNASVNLFIPTAYENTIGFAASVIGVCQGRTTYGVRCVSGILASGFTCGPQYPEVTITEDASTYIATETTQLSSAVMTLTETCGLGGQTTASCEATIVIAGSKGTSTTTSAVTMTGTDIPTYYRYQMPITAGAQLLHAPTNACVGAGHSIVVPLVGAVSAMFASVLIIIV